MQNGQQNIRHRRSVLGHYVVIPLERSVSVSRKKQRQALVIVNVGVAHRTTIQHQRMVEQVAVTIGSVLQLIQEVSDLTDVVLVELCEFSDLGGSLTVVCAGV